MDIHEFVKLFAEQFDETDIQEFSPKQYSRIWKSGLLYWLFQ